jgi:signal transduction histidine kinase
MELLYIAFYNIIENSLKYTDKGHVLVSAGRDGNNVRINIEDTGIGIPADRIGKIFDKFYRADHARNDSKSFGIGLTITKRILDIHKAEIQIESTPGIKTRFTVTFSGQG